MKISNLFAAAIAPIILAACATVAGESVSENTVLFENFENFDKNSGANCVIAEETAVVSEENALSGGKSLVVDTRKSKRQYPLALSILSPKFEKGYAYKLTFKYSTPEIGGGETPTFFVYMCYGKTSNTRDAVLGAQKNTLLFKTSKHSDTLSATFLVQADGERKIEITSAGGGVLKIDDIKIEKLPMPKYAWLFEDGAFKYFRRPPMSGKGFNDADPALSIPREKFCPFIDKYGQYMHRNWKNKILTDADLKTRLSEEQSFEKKLGAIPNRDKYFGLLDPDRKYAATGHFRAQKIGGKWWLITPDGNLFWSHGIDCVGATAPTIITNRAEYFADVSDKKYEKTAYWSRLLEGKFQTYNFYLRNIDKKYGDDAKNYNAVAPRRMRSWGVNTYGAWTRPELLENSEIPFALFTSAKAPKKLESQKKLNAYWQPVPDYFDENFERLTLEAVAKSARLMNSPYCVGVFVDNELPWQTETLVLPAAILSCKADQPAKIEFKKMLEKKYGEIEKLNAAWNSKYAGWDDFLAKTDFVPKTKSGKNDMLRIERKFYEKYFRTCRKAVKRVAPDTLYLGCRLAWTNELVEKSASKFCDVMSYNLYRDDVSAFKLPKNAKDKPVIVGEFHFGNQDRGVFGGGLRACATMPERIEKYNTYVLSAVENPIIVGAHWFQYYDQPTTGRVGDGENYSVGFVDIADTPVYEAVEAARKIAEEMYATRLSNERKVKITEQKTITY